MCCFLHERKEFRSHYGVSLLLFSVFIFAISFLEKVLLLSRGHKSCLCFLLQNVYYTSNQQLHVGVLSPTIDDDDNRCLVDVNSRPRLIECNYAKAKRMKLYWQFTQVILTQQTLQKVQKLFFYIWSVSHLFTNRTESGFSLPGHCVYLCSQCQLAQEVIKLVLYFLSSK